MPLTLLEFWGISASGILHVSQFNCLVFSWWIWINWRMKEAGNWTAIRDTSKNIPRTTEWEMAELLTEECPLLCLFPGYTPAFPFWGLQSKPMTNLVWEGMGVTERADLHLQSRSEKHEDGCWALQLWHWHTRGRYTSNAYRTGEALQQDTNGQTFHSFLFKIVLGEIASHCMLV